MSMAQIPNPKPSRAVQNLRLEPLKSQGELIKMIRDSARGMAASRVELQSLGDKTGESVQAILQKAAYGVGSPG